MEEQNVVASGLALGLSPDFVLFDRTDIQDYEIRIYLELRAKYAETGCPVMEVLDNLRFILREEVITKFKAYEEFVQYVCQTVAEQDKISEEKRKEKEDKK